jgi:YD repeat-containing protein
MGRKAKAILLATLATLLLQTSSARASEPEELYDAKQQLVQSVDPGGIAVEYIRDQNGNLVQARYADGRVVDYDENGEPRERQP